jgi:hypothetical protein
MVIKYNKIFYILQDPPKFTQIWIFGLKRNHLATLLSPGCRRVVQLFQLEGFVLGYQQDDLEPIL